MSEEEKPEVPRSVQEIRDRFKWEKRKEERRAEMDKFLEEADDDEPWCLVPGLPHPEKKVL